MFGRTVIIDGRDFFVSCLPETPWPEVYRRAEARRKVEQNIPVTPSTEGAGTLSRDNLTGEPQ